MKKQLFQTVYVLMVIMLLIPLSSIASTYKGTITIEVGEKYYVDIGYAYSTVSGYWSKSNSTFGFSSQGQRSCSIYGIKAGTGTLTWKGLVNTDWFEYYWNVEVKEPIVKVNNITLNSTSEVLKIGETKQLQATVSPNNATDKSVTWSSSNTNVATVSNNGLVRGVALGTATITCKANDGSGKQAICVVSVGVAIDATNFPDENFRNYLLSQSYGKDGVLTESEISAVEKVDVTYSNISSLKGIERFTALKTLYCDLNKLTSLDVSKNTALEYLDCAGNNLKSLDVSKNTALKELACFSNFRLTSLDISKNTELECLSCFYNALTTLDVTKNTALKDLKCFGNRLTSLDVSKNVALENLDCSRNKINGKNMDDLIEGLPQNEGGKNHSFNVIDNSEGNEENDCTQSQVAAAKAKGWTPQYYDGTYWRELECGVLFINATNFPDENFFNVLRKSSYGRDGVLTESEISDVIFMNVSSNKISSLKGIEFFPALKKLICNDNQLIYLDVSKNTALEYLDCYSNQLTSLDVSENPALEYLRCYNNQLASLDVSKNTVLDCLDCHKNQLTSLDVSKDTALVNLRCYDNQLSSLDVSGNTALERLECYSNQLTSLDVSGNMSLTYLECYGNQLTSLDVSKNTILKYLYCEGNQLTSLNISKDTALVSLRCDDNHLTSLDVSENPSLEYLYCYNNQLTSLDVSKNTVLEYLICSENQLTSLDVSKNPALKYLTCFGNQLTSLDVSGNSSLEDLYCYKNQLTSLDVSGNTALEHLKCYSNQLTSLDVSGNMALKYLYCYENQLTSLDVSKNPALKYLNCYSNQLTSLDISKDTALVSLSCSRNKISGKSMDDLIEELPQNEGGEICYFFVIDNSEGDEGNVCTKTQVAAAKVKGWTPLFYDGTYWREYVGWDPESADVHFLSVICENTNCDDLTQNDVLQFKATFENKGATGEIYSLIALIDINEGTIIANGEYVVREFKGGGEQTTVEYSYPLDTIAPGVYDATVLFYDWNSEYWIYGGEDTLWKITVKESSNGVKGDVNDDGSVNGTDLVALTNIILGKNPEKPSADVNGDGSVNGTDYVALANIILGKSNARRMSDVEDDQGSGNALMHIEPFDISAGETKEVAVCLMNQDDALTLLQFDLQLPRGLSIAKNGKDYMVDMSERASRNNHQLSVYGNEHNVRFLLASANNDLIEGTNGAVLRLKLTADAEFNGGMIVLDGILGVSPDEQEVSMPDCRYSLMGGTTGVFSINGNQGVPEIYSLSGKRQNTMKKGVNIVNGKQVIKK